MRAADCIVDIGPGAGEHGGEVVAVGTAEELMANAKIYYGCLSERASEDSGAGSSQETDGLAESNWSAAEQPEKYRCGISVGSDDLCDRSFRFGKKFSG